MRIIYGYGDVIYVVYIIIICFVNFIMSIVRGVSMVMGIMIV